MKKKAISVTMSALCCAFANAQLPKECFLHSELFGVATEGQYMSDLPTLLETYDPQMHLDEVKGFLHQDGSIGGIQLAHILG